MKSVPQKIAEDFHALRHRALSEEELAARSHRLLLNVCALSRPLIVIGDKWKGGYEILVVAKPGEPIGVKRLDPVPR